MGKMKKLEVKLKSRILLLSTTANDPWSPCWLSCDSVIMLPRHSRENGNPISLLKFPFWQSAIQWSLWV